MDVVKNLLRKVFIALSLAVHVLGGLHTNTTDYDRQIHTALSGDTPLARN